MSKEIEFKLNIPIHLWRNLVVMAAEDVRREDEFIFWLIHKETMQREHFSLQTSPVINEGGNDSA